MSNQELEIFYAGMVQARGVISTFTSAGNPRRPVLEIMFREEQAAHDFREHFGGVGQVTAESLPSNRRRINHVFRVRGAGARAVIERVRPYLRGRTAKVCEAVLARCSPP